MKVQEEKGQGREHPFVPRDVRPWAGGETWEGGLGSQLCHQSLQPLQGHISVISAGQALRAEVRGPWQGTVGKSKDNKNIQDPNPCP